MYDPPYGGLEDGKMVSFANADKWWNMNPPVPRIGFDPDESLRMGFVAIARAEMRFTADPSEVHYAKKIPPADADLYAFIPPGTAAAIYMQKFTHPVHPEENVVGMRIRPPQPRRRNKGCARSTPSEIFRRGPI